MLATSARTPPAPQPSASSPSGTTAWSFTHHHNKLEQTVSPSQVLKHRQAWDLQQQRFESLCARMQAGKKTCDDYLTQFNKSKAMVKMNFGTNQPESPANNPNTGEEVRRERAGNGAVWHRRDRHAIASVRTTGPAAQDRLRIRAGNEQPRAGRRRAPVPQSQQTPG
jgi:hypothetical protein